MMVSNPQGESFSFEFDITPIDPAMVRLVMGLPVETLEQGEMDHSTRVELMQALAKALLPYDDINTDTEESDNDH